MLGRLPVREDADRVVLISHRLWDTWFGRDSAVIGRSYFVSGQMRTVIGVMPPEFQFPSDQTLLWVAGESRLDQVQPGQLGLPIIARMKEGVTREQLATELTALSKQLPQRFGGPASYARLIAQHRAVVDPMLDRIVGPTVNTSLWVLLGAVSVVLLIACANVANLFMVRAEGRRRELAVRHAIGASRVQLVRLQMAEAFLVAVVAGALAVVLCALTLPLFLRAAPEGIPSPLAGATRWVDADHRLRPGVVNRPRVRSRARPFGVFSRPHPPARRRTGLNGSPALGARRAGRRPGRARPRTAHWLRPAGAKLPEAAQRGSGLRHEGHLYVSIRPGPTASR
jgi:hypothetical protein